jgi:O-antigen/teichoic acid export membrane protein
MPSNPARIAKNTLALYFRQILIMLVSLYTVRVVLETLGAEDYGIYNVVAGVVVLFSFLNNAMTSATQRFLNYTLGQNNIEQARDVYSISLIIHAIIGLFVVILAETAGIWFFYTWLNIPIERQNAAFIVYQFSIAVTVINILRVPYHATIIAYEKMSFFAFISIVESILKLGIVFLINDNLV